MTQKYIFKEDPIVFIFTLILGLISLFFPLLSYFFSIFALILISSTIFVVTRRLLGCIALVSLLVIISSRSYIDELDHDLSYYFSVYNLLSSGNFHEIYNFGDGFEVGWPLLYLAEIKLLWKFENPIYISIYNTIICFILLFVWLETKLFKIIPDVDKALVLGLVILFLSTTTFGYLQRQSLSIVIALYALTASNKKNLIFFIILSSMFHVTSFLIILLYLALFKIRLNKFILFLFLIVFFVLRLGFYDLIVFIHSMGLNIPGTHKILYYINNMNSFAIASKRFAILELILLLVVFFRWKYIDNFWKNIVAVTAILYLTLLGIPLLSERINFIVFYLYGFFIYLSFCFNSRSRVNYFFMKIFCIVYLLFFCIEKSGYVFISDDPFWQRYELIDFWIYF